MMKFVFVMCIALCGFSQVKVTFLVNHGWMIESEDSKVIVDGLFYREYEQIDAFTEEELTKIESFNVPFNDVDVLLISHQHGDHYSDVLTKKYLTKFPDLKVIGPAQVKEKHSSQNVLGQTNAIGKITSYNIGDVNIEQLTLPHMGQQRESTENTGYIITIGGQTFLQVGDAELSERNYAAYNLTDRKIDYLIIPFWQLRSETDRALINKLISPKMIIPSHIDAQNLTVMPNYLPTLIKNGIYFQSHFETKILE